MILNKADDIEWSDQEEKYTFSPYYKDLNDSPPEDHINLGVEFNAVIIAVTIILCTGAVFLNIGIMTYYWPKIKNLIPFLYFILSSSDFVTGVCAGIHSIIFITIIALKNSGYNPIFWLIIPSYFLTVVTFKVSAFVSMIFSVIRTINIVSPFSRVKRKPAIISIFVWLFIWLAVSSLETGLLLYSRYNLRKEEFEGEFVLAGYFYQPNKGKVFQNMGGIFNGTNECYLDLIYTASPVFLCASITLVATIIQVIFLLKTGNAVTEDPERDIREKRQISGTIILIGALFIACSTFTLYQPLVVCTTKLRAFYKARFYGTGYIPFFLNAALNPLILVARVSHLRVYMWETVTGRTRVATPGYRPTHQVKRTTKVTSLS